MRRHGWGGDIPVDDEEAVRRILDAARACIDAQGALSVSEVAAALGVTRQTVYRYFPTHDALLRATAVSAVDGFLNRLAEELRSITEPTEAVVEGIAYTLEQLPHDRYLGLLMQPGKASAFATGFTSEASISFGRSILARFEVDWASAGFHGQRFDELVEFMLRTLQSFILDPGGPSRQGTELRAFLHRWVAPAVRQRNADAHVGYPATSADQRR
ncbi:MAG: TetR/AcrR family transcriptional regulator [Actinobacteria bacterium]|nr:TetR/AcrR family transcriptional regulator [Actinomycetota bacterium]